MNTQNHFCPVCHGGRKQPGHTIPYSRTGVCDLCGTDWLADSVAEMLEQIVEQAREKHLVVEIANWRQDNTAIA